MMIHDCYLISTTFTKPNTLSEASSLTGAHSTTFSQRLYFGRQDALTRFAVNYGTYVCIYTFAVTFSKMENLVKFLIFTLGLQIRPIRTESADKQQADEV